VTSFFKIYINSPFACDVSIYTQYFGIYSKFNFYTKMISNSRNIYAL